MKVKLILPALSEARTPHYRQIKYSLFAPLGMAQLAAYLDSEDDVNLQDENVERLNLDDEPDLVAIHVRITSAYRVYEIADHYRAKGAYVCLGGLHVTSVPEEAAPHADSIFLGPGEDTWPMFLKDFRAGRPRAVYQSTNRNLEGVPVPRRDLIKKQLYLVPSTIVVSRGCPHLCGFCSNESFFAKGKHFYTRRVDEALAEIESLPGRNLYFLDDHLLGNAKFAEELFEGMRGMGRLWQTATTVRAALKPGLLEKAASCGLRSLVMGFETLNAGNLRDVGKVQNLNLDYNAAIRRMHDNGVLVNGTFVFGFDKDNEDVFDRTVDWALEQGVETATFHILTPYPGTTLYSRMKQADRILTTDWRLYDTCHAVFKPNSMTPKALEEGYHRAYSRFYKWGSILKGARIKPTAVDSLRHLLYTAGWHKFVTSWNLVIRCGGLPVMRPLLKLLLSGFGKYGTNFKNGEI